MATARSSVQPPFRILLVDDNSHGNTARKTLLEEQGYEVETTLSGEEALEMFLRAPFDLVVTDFKMKKMGGLELIACLREQSRHASIILLSGFAGIMGLDEKSTGADAVLNKSCKEEEQLLRSVKQLLTTPRRKPANSQPRKSVNVARSG